MSAGIEGAANDEPPDRPEKRDGVETPVANVPIKDRKMDAKQAWKKNRLALLFLVLYAAAIAGFTALYKTVTPDGFYAPNTRYEKAWSNEIESMTSGMEGILRVWEKIQPDDNPLSSLVALRISNLRIIEGGRIAFDIRYRHQIVLSQDPMLLPPNTSTGDILFEDGDVSLTASLSTAPLKKEDETFDLGLSFHSLKLKQKPSVACDDYLLLAATQDTLIRHWGEKEREVCLSPDGKSAVQNFLDAYNGLSFDIGRDTARMLYLSVVVITTLGLGDIVPISNAARLLVGLEAITGIILIGAFLNSVSLRQ